MVVDALKDIVNLYLCHSHRTSAVMLTLKFENQFQSINAGDDARSDQDILLEYLSYFGFHCEMSYLSAMFFKTFHNSRNNEIFITIFS